VPVKIRILSAANKHMQRLGYLKLLVHHTARTETSNISTLGGQLVDVTMKRIRIEPPFSQTLTDYIQYRLTGGVYAGVREAVLAKKPTAAAIELQDLYLCDPKLPSNTGKLNDSSREKYPYFGTALDLIKPGTWSIMTRGLLLVHLTPKEELASFDAYQADRNPLLLSREQAAVLLFCFLDNDSVILFPLFQQLMEFSKSFDEREAGDLLPAILRSAVTTLNKGSLSFEDRSRLAHLDKVADTIEQYRGRSDAGTTAREVACRVRLEPFCDLGLLKKPDRHRFIYELTPAFRRLMTNWPGADATDHFLDNRFFTTLAGIHGLTVKQASAAEARAALGDAGTQLKSALGYSPIKDCSLLAGIRLLFDRHRVLELGTSSEVLRDWQKAEPDLVRFTVDRMGALAYVKFLKPVTPPTPSKP